MTLPADFLTRYGPWAVVTGASSGIGAEFAIQLAAAGLSLVLVARRLERLEEAAKSLMETYPIQVKPLAADLSTDAGVQSVIDGTQDLDVGLLVNNAGMELHGSFFRPDAQENAKMIALNVTAVTTLAHAFGKRMGIQKRGGIIFTSSMAKGGVPGYSCYSSTKAYVSTLAATLRFELAERGVEVLCFEPGMVKSEMHTLLTADLNMDKPMYIMEADDCVKETLKCLYDRKAQITPGLPNKVMATVVSWFPEWARIGLMGKMVRDTFKAGILDFPES